MIARRHSLIFALSLLALVFLIALGFVAWRSPEIRDRPIRVAPINEQQLLDFGLIRASSLPLFWSGKGKHGPITHTAEAIGTSLAWRNPFIAEPSAYVEQKIWKYRSEEAAIAAYATGVAETFDRGRNNEVKWTEPDDLDGPAHADEAVLQCLGDETDFSGWERLRASGVPANRILLPTRHCVLVARYAGLVIELHSNLFQRDGITVPRFQGLITEADQRGDQAASWWRELYEEES